MEYIHRGDLHDFGDKPTDYGEELAKKLGKIETREEKAEKEYSKVIAKIKAENKETKQKNERNEENWKKKYAGWKEECSSIEQNCFMNTAKWEDECKKHFLGFFKKILRIGKPKLKLPEKPGKPEELKLKPIPQYDMWKFLPIDK